MAYTLSRGFAKSSLQLLVERVESQDGCFNAGASASWVHANYSIFFAAEGTDAGLVGSVRLSQTRVSGVYGAEDCAGARGELISTLAAACWVTVVGEHGIKQVPEYLGFAVIRSDDSSANGLLGRKPRTRSRKALLPHRVSAPSERVTDRRVHIRNLRALRSSSKINLPTTSQASNRSLP